MIVTSSGVIVDDDKVLCLLTASGASTILYIRPNFENGLSETNQLSKCTSLSHIQSDESQGREASNGEKDLLDMGSSTASSPIQEEQAQTTVILESTSNAESTVSSDDIGSEIENQANQEVKNDRGDDGSLILENKVSISASSC